MALAVTKATGMPLLEGVTSAADLPHTISYAIMYRARIDSFNELPKEKRPPRNLWDKPYKLEQFLEDIFKTKNEPKGKSFIEYNPEDVE